MNREIVLIEWLDDECYSLFGDNLWYKYEFEVGKGITSEQVIDLFNIYYNDFVEDTEVKND